MSETRTYRGSCHCGSVQFEVDTALEVVARCNCSLCRRKGILMTRVPASALRVTAGEDALSVYQWNTGAARHYFCSNCGIYTHHQPRTAPDERGINVGCLEGVDPFAFTDVKLIDGASLSSVDH